MFQTRSLLSLKLGARVIEALEKKLAGGKGEGRLCGGAVMACPEWRGIVATNKNRPFALLTMLLGKTPATWRIDSDKVIVWETIRDVGLRPLLGQVISPAPQLPEDEGKLSELLRKGAREVTMGSLAALEFDMIRIALQAVDHFAGDLGNLSQT